MLIRPATIFELPTLLELEQCVVNTERLFNNLIKARDARYYDIEALIESDNACLLVAEENNEIIATGYLQIRSSKKSLVHTQHGYLGFMYVKPEYRGQGLNQKIIDKLIKWGKAREIHDFYLDVYADNESAIKAYEKAGFASNMVEMKLSIRED